MSSRVPFQDDGAEDGNTSTTRPSPSRPGTTDTMADEPEPPSPGQGRGDDQSSSDQETIKGNDPDDCPSEEIAADVDEDTTSSTTLPSPPAGTRHLSSNRYRQLLRASVQDSDGASSEDGSTTDAIPRRVGSPIGSLLSITDDALSVQGSFVSSPSVSSSVLPSVASRASLSSPTPSFRPFDRRFSSRIASPSGLLSARPSSPAFLSGHSRGVSLTSQLALNPDETESSSPPWEVVRWTRLNKINSQAFSETGRRNFGSPTCLAVSASIVVGTSKGIILMFDYSQNLKMIIGPGTKAVESGPIRSLAVSFDHSTVAGGHANGNIFTWDTARASRPFLTIPFLDPSQVQKRTMDGHFPNVAITHLGFLGSRRTALVSADDRGMAFSHLATRGTGALGRTVKTCRILGRYPEPLPPAGKPHKPSSIMAFSSLPLGNVDTATDTMGLTAMLTPYLLVVVSTMPIAQTQHKSSRPKGIPAHSALTGCLAWFPAVKLKVADAATGSQVSKVKLVYCWSNVLTVLDVDEVPAEDKDKPPSLTFRARSRWKCEEPIVAMQWLSRSVLTVLTISQRLVVLEDRSMRMTEAFDLIHKHIYHVDLFSKQLHNLVEQLDEEDASMHGVVADAFYMGFKAYKGRLFLLGFNDLSLGALSNWADRLIALMEHDNYIGAIQLATSYYTGDADKLTVGLPEDTALRHSMVRNKLMEIMSASLKYAFGQRKKKRRPYEPVEDDRPHLRELAETCFVACHQVGDTDFVFEDMYDFYADAGLEGIFLETLEPYILDQSVVAVPPGVVKAMVAYFVGKGLESRLEEMVCHMNTATLDLDQITQLCKQHGLYDALIYVWNQAMRDYITPLIDLMALLVPLVSANGAAGPQVVREDDIDVNALKMFPYLSYVLTGRVYPTGAPIPDPVNLIAKAELYWFLFSGKSIVWPRGGNRRFLTKPGQSEEPSFPYLRLILKFDAPSFLSSLNEAFEDSFLNDSPEKSLASGARGSMPEEQVFGLTVDRQYIVSILMEIMNPSDFAPEDTIYLDMFVARNLPKYPQYLLFPGSALTRVLVGLCHFPGGDLAEDAQLSAEYLLSVYHPPDMQDLIPAFRQANFFRILKRTYRVDGQYGKLAETYFEDPDDQELVFPAIEECLRPSTSSSSRSGTSRRQVADVHRVIREHAYELVELDPTKAAQTLDACARELHSFVLEAVADRPDLQYRYLKTLLEPADQGKRTGGGKDRFLGGDGGLSPSRELVEQYLRLMCTFEPAHVSDYIGVVQSAVDLRLEALLPTMEQTGVIDAAIVLMAREGQVAEAMGRLVTHLGTLEAALQGLLSSDNLETAESKNADADANADVDADSPAQSPETVQNGLRTPAEDLVRALQKYSLVGVWLCQRQTRALQATGSGAGSGSWRKQRTAQSGKDRNSEALAADESLWLDLIDTSVQVTKRLSTTLRARAGSAEEYGAGQQLDGLSRSQDQGTTAMPGHPSLDVEKLVGLLRSLVQTVFTALLNATSSPAGVSATTTPTTATANGTIVTGTTATTITTAPRAPINNLSFLRILRAFLGRAAAASPSLAELRGTLASIFAAYAHEASILALANRLLERSVFAGVSRAAELRQRGWRPRGSACEACGRRVWGPGLDQAAVLDEWEAMERRRAREAEEKGRGRWKGGGGTLASGGGQGGGGGGGRGSDDERRWKDRQEKEGQEEGEFAGGGGKGKGKGKGKELMSRDPRDSLPPPRPAGGRMHGGGEENSRHLLAPPAGTGTGGRESSPRRGGGGGNSSRSGTPNAAATDGRTQPALEPLLALACRHIFHKSCLEALQAREGGEENEEGVDGWTGASGARIMYKCPIDG